MRALSLLQPFSEPEALAYLQGVVAGDGWCSRLSLGLRAKDRDFALVFALGVNDVFGTDLWPRRDERGYWLIRAGNKTGRFNAVLQEPRGGRRCRAAWLRGFFDAEGNVSLLQRPQISPGAWLRRVAFYGTDSSLMERAAGYLTELGIRWQIRPMTNSAGHRGTRTVLELRLLGSAENYRRFAEIVGSTIGRKSTVLDALPRSYQPPGYQQRGQARGAASKRSRAETVRLPALLSLITERLQRGEPVTHRAIRGLDGYSSARTTLRLTHLQIVGLARQA